MAGRLPRAAAGLHRPYGVCSSGHRQRRSSQRTLLHAQCGELRLLPHLVARMAQRAAAGQDVSTSGAGHCHSHSAAGADLATGTGRPLPTSLLRRLRLLKSPRRSSRRKTEQNGRRTGRRHSPCRSRCFLTTPDPPRLRRVRVTPRQPPRRGNASRTGQDGDAVSG